MTSRKCVSVRQMYLLVNFLENHRDLALGRLKSREGSAMSSRLWVECAGILNAEADGDERTPKQWNKWYTDFKCRLLSRIRQNQRSTDEGPGPRINNLSPLEKRMAALIGANSEVVGRSGTPENDEQINPLLPAYSTISSMPALPTSPLHSTNECVYICNNGDEDIIVNVAPSTFERYEDIVDVASATSTQNNIIKSEQEVPAPRPRKRRRRALKQFPPPSSELERTRNMLASIERSRLDVERLMANGYNKMADAANRMADAANKSADAQCRIAEALDKISKSLLKRNARWSVDSSEEE